MSKSETQLTLQLRKILVGIDKAETETEEGWWETSTGAKFGAMKLAQLEEYIQQALTSLKSEMVRLDDITEELSAKYDLVIPQGVHGFRVGISECQRVIDTKLKELK